MTFCQAGCHLTAHVHVPFSPTVKLVIPWVDIQKLERTSNVFLTDTIRITTQNKERDFSTFLNLDEVFKIMEQLADVTLRRLLDNEVFDLDPDLQEPSQITKRWGFSPAALSCSGDQGSCSPSLCFQWLTWLSTICLSHWFQDLCGHLTHSCARPCCKTLVFACSWRRGPMLCRI